MIDHYKKCSYQHLSILEKKKKRIALSEQMLCAAWEKQAADSALASLARDSASEVYSGTVQITSLTAL